MTSGPVFGIDISSYQGGIYLPAARREGIDFCVVKATEGPYQDGTHYVNPYYQEQFIQAHDSGMIVGSYHYLVETNPMAQVDHFLDTIYDLDDQLLMVDYEAYDDPYEFLSPTEATLRGFVKELQSRVGNHPIIVYSADWYWMASKTGDITDLGVITWDANYPKISALTWQRIYEQVASQGFKDNWGGQRPRFWQFTGSAKVANKDNVDVNVFDGTIEELKSLTVGTGGEKKQMVKAADLIAAARMIRGIFYRIWLSGGMPMWWGDGTHGWHAGEQPDLDYMNANGANCADLINYALQYCGLDAIGGTGDFSDALVDWDYFDPTTPGVPGAIAVTPYGGAALEDQGHVLLYTGEHSTIQSLFSDGVTEKYSDIETAGFLELRYYGKLPGVDYSDTTIPPGPQPSDFIKSPRWMAITKDGTLVAEGADFSRGWFDTGYKKGDWSWHGPKEI